MPARTDSFASLPEDCLILILRHLPLLDQIRLRLISTQWESILTKLLRSRKSLKLFGAYQQIEDYCRELYFLNLKHLSHLKLKPIGQLDDDLVLESRCFSKEFCNLILKLFPNLTHLSLYLTSDYQYPDLEYLTAQLSKQVTTLTLAGYVQPKSVSKLRTRLGKVIGELPVLERLDLLFKLRLARNVNWDPTEARPFYNRTQIHSLDELVPPLIGRIKSDQFRELNLNWTSNLSLDKLIQQVKTKRFKNAEKVQSLRLSAIEDPHLQDFCKHFPGIESLDIEFANWPMASQLIPELHKLEKLRDLRLAFIQIDRIVKSDQRWDDLPSLRSVKRLTLAEAGRFDGQQYGLYDYHSAFNGEHFCEILARLFPDLEELTVRAQTNYSDILEARIRENLNKSFSAKFQEFRFESRLDYRNMFGKQREEMLFEQERILGFLL